MDKEVDFQGTIKKTRRWIGTVVIDLNLCPFAEKVFNSELIRYAVSADSTPEAVLKTLEAELLLLASSPRDGIETTVFIFPNALSNFYDFNDFTHDADELVGALGLRGTLQIAGFHPSYQFAGTTPESPENYTNRSPYPMLHLLREVSVSEVSAGPIDLSEIPKRNIRTLQELGHTRITEKLKRL